MEETLDFQEEYPWEEVEEVEEAEEAEVAEVVEVVEEGTTQEYVADDFGYKCLDKGKRKLVNVIDGFQAQRGDKSRAMP